VPFPFSFPLRRHPLPLQRSAAGLFPSPPPPRYVRLDLFCGAGFFSPLGVRASCLFPGKRALALPAAFSFHAFPSRRRRERSRLLVPLPDRGCWTPRVVAPLLKTSLGAGFCPPHLRGRSFDPLVGEVNFPRSGIFFDLSSPRAFAVPSTTGARAAYRFFFCVVLPHRFFFPRGSPRQNRPLSSWQSRRCGAVLPDFCLQRTGTFSSAGMSCSFSLG